MKNWGPTFPCPACAAPVQYLFRTTGYARLFNAGSEFRHQCRATQLPPEVETFECLCGVIVDRVGGVRFGHRSADLHLCNMLPSPAPVMAPTRPPIVEAPTYPLVPRGAILL